MKKFVCLCTPVSLNLRFRAYVSLSWIWWWSMEAWVMDTPIRLERLRFSYLNERKRIRVIYIESRSSTWYTCSWFTQRRTWRGLWSGPSFYAVFLQTIAKIPTCEKLAQTDCPSFSFRDLTWHTRHLSEIDSLLPLLHWFLIAASARQNALPPLTLPAVMWSPQYQCHTLTS